MKSSLIPLLHLISLIYLCSAGCSKGGSPDYIPEAKINFDSLSLESSMKGWELYSWPNGDDWNYSLLPGTNRLKSYEEVTKNYLIVHGTDSLKMLLDKLPENEFISWISEEWLESIWSEGYEDLSLPDKKAVNEIKDYCIQHNLNLSIST